MLNNPLTDTNPTDFLLHRFKVSRKYSTDLIKNLSPDDCQAQSMDDASPAKWHLAHVTWFYEVMVLRPFETNFQYWDPHFAVLFNSYYNGVGDKYPRTKRGLLTRPSLNEVLEWRKNIDDRIAVLIQENFSEEFRWLVELGINHEQQHQELLLTDIQHLFYSNTLLPRYYPSNNNQTVEKVSFHWIEGRSGLHEIGFSGERFHFDNEGPAHITFIQPHSMGNVLVSNQEWLRFVESGGYEQERWWLDAGWAWVQSEKITAPLYWKLDEATDTYHHFSLYGNQPLDNDAPVSNVSYFEADAFARWADKNIEGFAGARLPTEFEWEVFANTKHDLACDLFGKVWQWTGSSYSPYPRYKPWSGIAGEYNGKFMVNQIVLRGGSSYTTPGHSRMSYRNFFPPNSRWQMTGLRLAKDGL
jgi:ergothioneine biosynthesis protein EgtB